MICLPVIFSRAVIGALLLTGEGMNRLAAADRYALEVLAEQALVLLGHPDTFEARQNACSAEARAKIALNTVQQEIGAVLRFDYLSGKEWVAHPADFQARLGALLERADSGVRWLERGIPPRDREESMLCRVLNDATRTISLIAELRELIHGSPARRRSFDLNEVVLESLASQGTRLRLTNVHADIQSLRVGESLVFGDRLLVSQAISQALGNAIDAMADIQDRERILSVRCDRTDAADIRLEISDSGTGAEGGLENLFTAFYTTRPEKLGLGLALIRLIFELHNGTVMIKPNFPHGLVFRATLPARH
jgi:signal transduction histidine kinase